MWVCCNTLGAVQDFPIKRTFRSLKAPKNAADEFACGRLMDTNENKSSVYHFVLQEIEKSHNQNRKTKDGTADNNKSKERGECVCWFFL